MNPRAGHARLTVPGLPSCPERRTPDWQWRRTHQKVHPLPAGPWARPGAHRRCQRLRSFRYDLGPLDEDPALEGHRRAPGQPSGSASTVASGPPKCLRKGAVNEVGGRDTVSDGSRSAVAALGGGRRKRSPTRAAGRSSWNAAVRSSGSAAGNTRPRTRSRFPGGHRPRSRAAPGPGVQLCPCEVHRKSRRGQSSDAEASLW